MSMYYYGFVRFLPIYFIITVLSSALICARTPKDFTEEGVRKSGIVPVKRALELLMSSDEEDKMRSPGHSFREPRYNSQLDWQKPTDAQKSIDEKCAISASLACGKKVLNLFERTGREVTPISIHERCEARQDFLECLPLKRENCQYLANKNELPTLPEQSVIRDLQSKISKALWTSGGCLLS